MGRLLDEDIVIGAISKILSERCGGNTVWWKPVAEAVVKNLPSAQPSNGACWGCQCEKVEKLQSEREKGEWIQKRLDYNNDVWIRWECSRCGYLREKGWKYILEAKKPEALFCEMCGADMRGEQE